MNDFYCDEVLSGRTAVERVLETVNVLAFHHTRPFYPVHVVVIPKRHVTSLLTLGEDDNDLLIELVEVIKRVAAQVVEEHGACRVTTNLGEYQESKYSFALIYSEFRLQLLHRIGPIDRLGRLVFAPYKIEYSLC
jgi:histidine triad (HIT) family protein